MVAMVRSGAAHLRNVIRNVVYLPSAQTN